MANLIVSESGLPKWEYASGRQVLGRRRDQFYAALKLTAARDELHRIEKDSVCSPGVFVKACEHAWKQPGLGAMETVAEVRRYLEERFRSEERSDASP